jgi:hypothetical protein
MCARQPHLRERHEGARLAARPQGGETQGLPVPPRRPGAPRPVLLFSIAGGVYDEPTFTQGPAKNKIMSIDSTG